jgi:hypothetical protein
MEEHVGLTTRDTIDLYLIHDGRCSSRRPLTPTLSPKYVGEGELGTRSHLWEREGVRLVVCHEFCKAQ